MKVCYLGRASARTNPAPQGTDDVLELLWDDWDDFGNKNSFGLTCQIKGERVYLDGIRLLAPGEPRFADALNRLRGKGWDGTFPIPEIEYISVPADITFYQQLKARLGMDGARQVAMVLRDASYHVKVLEDAGAIQLSQGRPFVESLQRERGSQTAFFDGWRVFEDQIIAVQNFRFEFTDVYKATSTLALNFDTESLLPHEMNVLIGPNGAGKSRILLQMVRAWLGTGSDNERFPEPPNLTQLVVVSYSPFEQFPVDLQGVDLRDKEVYRYFGLLGRLPETGQAQPGKITVDLRVPERDAVRSIIQCAKDDHKFRVVLDWARKVRTMERVLGVAFQFDYAAVELPIGSDKKNYYWDDPNAEATAGFIFEDRRYLPISSHNVWQLHTERLLQDANQESGIHFFRDDVAIKLSSGQRLFTYIVINLLGVMRRNSLILIDEPELFLHPTLEIKFVEMLKEILASFNSKALLATHSEVVVREIPAECVHVLQRTATGLAITHPPFETFGGDIQRISSYVFGDDHVSKPFEQWAEKQIEHFGSKEALIEKLGDGISRELLIQIKMHGGE